MNIQRTRNTQDSLSQESSKRIGISRIHINNIIYLNDQIKQLIQNNPPPNILTSIFKISRHVRLIDNDHSDFIVFVKINDDFFNTLLYTSNSVTIDLSIINLGLHRLFEQIISRYMTPYLFINYIFFIDDLSETEVIYERIYSRHISTMINYMFENLPPKRIFIRCIVSNIPTRICDIVFGYPEENNALKNLLENGTIESIQVKTINNGDDLMFNNYLLRLGYIEQ